MAVMTAAVWAASLVVGMVGPTDEPMAVTMAALLAVPKALA